MTLIHAVRVACEAADAQDYDYFNPTNDPHIDWLRGDTKKNHLDLALNRIREGNYSLVIRELLYLISVFPNHPDALPLLGHMAKLTNKTSLAIRGYERALALFPQYPITYAQYGNFLVEIGRVDAGIQKLQQAIERNSEFTPAYVWLAKAYYKKGDTDLARESAARARELGYPGEIVVGVPKE
jgi:predicted Zn-dependent protease